MLRCYCALTDWTLIYLVGWRDTHNNKSVTRPLVCVVAIPATRPPEESKGALLEVVGREELQGQMHLGVSSVVALRAYQATSPVMVEWQAMATQEHRHAIFPTIQVVSWGPSHQCPWECRTEVDIRGGTIYIYVFKIRHLYIYIATPKKNQTDRKAISHYMRDYKL